MVRSIGRRGGFGAEQEFMKAPRDALRVGSLRGVIALVKLGVVSGAVHGIMSFLLGSAFRPQGMPASDLGFDSVLQHLLTDIFRSVAAPFRFFSVP